MLLLLLYSTELSALLEEDEEGDGPADTAASGDEADSYGEAMELTGNTSATLQPRLTAAEAAGTAGAAAGQGLTPEFASEGAMMLLVMDCEGSLATP